MKEALETVSSGKFSYRKAAYIFSVPKDALHNRVNNKLKLSPSKQQKDILEKFICVRKVYMCFINRRRRRTENISQKYGWAHYYEFTSSSL